MLALQLEDVARPDHVRRPQRLVELLAIDPAELSRQVVNEIDRAGPLQKLLELTVGTNIRPEHLAISLMLKIAPKHRMPTPTQLVHQRTTKSALRTCNENIRHS
jgi:hypothetical protein